MRDRFPGYYTPSADEFKKLWEECLFVPDTNILLHLFRYGSNTTAQVLETLQRLKPRVWIPYRVGFEFHRRWRDVDQANRDAYDKLSREIEAQGRKLSGLFDEYTRHQTIDAKKEQEEVASFVKQFLKRIEASKAQHPKLEDAQTILDRLSDLVGDAVGTAPSDEQLAELTKEGKRRFEARIPPGLRDNKKEGADAYGDYFIWQEAMEKAKEAKKPIVMITDDVKDDWWLEFRGHKIGPRPELVAEMRGYAGQRFYLYTLSQFLDYATGFLDRKIDPAAIQEIKQDELQLRKAAEVSKLPVASSPKDLEYSFLKQRSQLYGQMQRTDREIERLSFSDESFEARARELLERKRDLRERYERTSHNLRAIRKIRHRTPEETHDALSETMNDTQRHLIGVAKRAIQQALSITKGDVDEPADVHHEESSEDEDE